MAKHMQVDATNPLVGLDGRTSLLINLSKALTTSRNFFGPDGRPGNMLGKPYNLETITFFRACFV